MLSTRAAGQLCCSRFHAVGGAETARVWDLSYAVQFV